MRTYKEAAALYAQKRAAELGKLREKAQVQLAMFLAGEEGKDAVEMLRESGRSITIGMSECFEYLLDGQGMRSRDLRKEEPRYAAASLQDVLGVVEDPRSFLDWLKARLDEIAAAAPDRISP